MLKNAKGLDLARLADKQQFAFVDGLSELFSAPQQVNQSQTTLPTAGSMSRTTLPHRSLPGSVSGRTPPAVVPSENTANLPRSPIEPGVAKKLHFSGRGNAALDALEKDITAVTQQLKGSMEDEDKLILIVDQPDFLLAATGPEMGIGATEMAEWVTGLQQVSLKRSLKRLRTSHSDRLIFFRMSIQLYSLWRLILR